MILGVDTPKNINLEVLRKYLLPYLEASRKLDWNVDGVIIEAGNTYEQYLKLLCQEFGLPLIIGNFDEVELILRFKTCLL
jgi:hypothetical protein